MMAFFLTKLGRILIWRKFLKRESPTLIKIYYWKLFCIIVFLLTLFMSLERRFCATGKASVLAKLEIGRKKTKYFSECRKKEVKINSDCYFLVFILCTCIVLILLKYINIYLVLI